MADKIISDYSPVSTFATGDLLLLERGSQYYNLDADNMLDHLTTDDLAQGSTNKYAETSVLNTWLATKDSDDLAQGATNKYATTSVLNTWLATKTLADVPDQTGAGRYVRVQNTKTTITSAAVTALNTTPVKIFNQPSGYAFPFMIAIKANAGATTAYTVAGITNLQVVHGDDAGTAFSAAASYTTPISFLAATSVQAIQMMPAAASSGQKVSADYDLYLTCDSLDPTGGDVEYVVEVLWFQLDI